MRIFFTGILKIFQTAGNELFLICYVFGTDTRESILQKILSENKLTEQEGSISFESKPYTLYRNLKRKAVEYLLFEMLDSCCYKQFLLICKET